MAHAEAPDRLDMARSEAGHPAPARGNVALWTLWFGFLGAPLGWSLQSLANTAVASHGCYPSFHPLGSPAIGGMRGILFVISLVVRLVAGADEENVLGFVVSLVGVLVLGFSGYLGGKLAYHFGVRVAAEGTQAEGFR